jgi:SAM-dependent methyltransferase
MRPKAAQQKAVATIDPAATRELTGRIEPFDSFWEGPEDIESGYAKFEQFYRVNYLPYMPKNRDARILVISCGPGYFVNMLVKRGYQHVTGIDSFESKVKHAQARNLDCHSERAFPYLAERKNTFDAIVCEQEINHLTKEEILVFLRLARESLVPGGTLVVHVLNGGNPITGAEALAQNFDHYNTFTEYTLRQVLEFSEFRNVRVFPLNLYVFYNNPFNYVAWGASTALSFLFRGLFVLYGKSNKLFTKKIAAACTRLT